MHLDIDKLWNFEEFDLFVTYEGTVSGTLTEQITYGGDCLGGLPAQGNWCIESINGDMLDPGILNSAEGANIRVQVNEILDNVNAVVSITTDNGVTDTVMAPYCGPSCYQIHWSVIRDEAHYQFSNIGLGGGGPEEFEAGGTNADNWRSIFDLTDMTEWRIIMHLNDFNSGVTTAACVLGVQFSPDNQANWFALDNGIQDVMTTNTVSCFVVGSFVSAWAPINATAQTDVWMRIVGDDNNAADPRFGTIDVQFRS